MMFLIVAFGAILKKNGILQEEGREILTNLVLYALLPCNIISSFQMELSMEIIKGFAWLLAVSLLVQVFSYWLSRSLYNRKPEAIRRVLQYCTIVSNSGFLGLPVAEGVFGPEGMMYASVFIIPMRVMMWSAGLACFTDSSSRKNAIRKIALHPCIVAVYIGLGMMFFRDSLETGYELLMQQMGASGIVLQIIVQALDRGIRALGGSTTAVTMLLIGSMLADLKPADMVDKDTLLISAVRLGVLPGIFWCVCHFLKMEPLLSGICVLMTGMPAGSSSAILAAKYGCDYRFATKCVVVSTLLSMLTIPMWCMIC